MRRVYRLPLFTVGLLSVVAVLLYCRPHTKPASGRGARKRDAIATPRLLRDELRRLRIHQLDASALRYAPLPILSPSWQLDSLDLRNELDEGTPHHLLSRFLMGMHTLKDVANCSWDASLDMDRQFLEGKKFLLAANLRDNEEVLPHLIVQLWHTISLLPEESVFVSIYENASSDKTGSWIVIPPHPHLTDNAPDLLHSSRTAFIKDLYLEILKDLLAAMNVRHEVIIGGDSRDPIDKKKEKGNRIEQLAQLRNVALGPLWQHPRGLRSKKSARKQAFQSGWPADTIVFFNDVYLCAKDIIRLIYLDVDMACGWDLYHGDESAAEPKATCFVAKSQVSAIAKDGPLMFYDTWVARDITGEVIHRVPPYFKDKQSLKRMEQGLPFPVRSCWNGMTAIKAKPFIDQNVRFRSTWEGECFQSECKLVCDDLVRLGYDKIVIDPSVRMTYKLEDARRRYDSESVWGVGETVWGEARLNPVIWSDFKPRNSTRCCLLDVWGRVQFDNCPHFPLWPEASRGRH